MDGLCTLYHPKSEFLTPFTWQKKKRTKYFQQYVHDAIMIQAENNSGAPARAKRAWDRASYSWNMVNLFSFGCHVIDRAYVRTRLQIVRVG